MTRLAGALLAMVAGCSGGSEWDKVSPPPAEDEGFVFAPVDVWAFGEQTWVANGTTSIAVYDGANWSSLEAPSGVFCFFAFSPTDVWMCSDTAVLHYDGAAFTSHDIESATGLGEAVDIWGPSNSDIWVVGRDAIAAHYNGQMWERVAIPESSITSVWGSGASDIYVTGTFGAAHYDGTEWSSISEFYGGEGQVWGTSSSDVWVLGDSSPWHFNGESWEESDEVLDDFVGEIAYLWGSSSSDIWAVGTPGTIAHFDGDSWDEKRTQAIGSPYLQQLVAIHGSGPDDVWAVGHQLGENGSKPLFFHHD